MSTEGAMLMPARGSRPRDHLMIFRRRSLSSGVQRKRARRRARRAIRRYGPSPVLSEGAQMAKVASIRMSWHPVRCHPAPPRLRKRAGLGDRQGPMGPRVCQHGRRGRASAPRSSPRPSGTLDSASVQLASPSGSQPAPGLGRPVSLCLTVSAPRDVLRRQRHYSPVGRGQRAQAASYLTVPPRAVATHSQSP